MGTDGPGIFSFSGVTIDRADNLYVTTKENLGRPDAGTVFMLSPTATSRFVRRMDIIWEPPNSRPD